MQYAFPRFRAAAVQAASVFLDRERTTQKACDLIREAARHGARLVVFPETYIAGYPHWAWFLSIKEGEKYFPLLVKSSVGVPGPVTDELCRVARECDAYVAMGINETSSSSFAEIFNTLLLIAPDGQIIAKHRKTIPTFYEKLVWSFGDASALRPYDTEIGRVGMLVCGENSNPLARFALIAQGEQVHIANYPALPKSGQVGGYSIRRSAEIRATAHSFEGKVFTVVAASTIDDGIKQLLGDTPERRDALEAGGTGFTAIIGPDGNAIAGPLADNEEGIVYGDIDLTEAIKWKMYHDYSGNYNRFDLFSLNINREVRAPLREVRTATGSAGPSESAVEPSEERLRQLISEAVRRELQQLVALDRK